MKTTISVRLWAMIFVSVLALLGVGFTGTWTTRTAQATLTNVMDDTMPSIAMLSDIQATFLSLEIEASVNMASKGFWQPEVKEKTQKTVASLAKKLETQFDGYSRVVTDPDGQRMLTNELAILDIYMPLVTDMMNAAIGFDIESVTKIMTEQMRPVSQMLNEALEAHAEHNRKIAADFRAEVERQATIGKMVSWLAMALGALTIVILGVVTVREVNADLTEKKQREEEIKRQRAGLAHQGRLVLLGELASALAHEINQPLAAITALTAVCARKAAEYPAVLELVRAIEEQAIRSGEIAWRMRGFARRQRLGRSVQFVWEVITAVVKWIRIENSNDKRVSIDILSVEDELPAVEVDRVEIEQVLINLVRNAIEATLPTAKDVRVVIGARLLPQTGELEVTVTDWGVGFPAGTNLDVFLPFSSTKEHGLGLGLTISSSIIEGHGGRLWATENPEGGAILHFTLPVAERLV